jgi:RNA polymerase sigma factor (sigma-70 family)
MSPVAAPSSFETLYAEHSPAARRAALALVPWGEAEDLVAEAFARVLAACERGGGPEAEFRPYLMAVVRNLARTWNARRGRTVPVACPEPRDAAPAAGDLAERRAEMAMVARAFGSLPPRWRAVLWATEVEGRTPSDLARALGISPGAVSQLASRARYGLSRAWESERQGRPVGKCHGEFRLPS